ncbi:unnamed protein product [Penicillium camemberti]|uniref:Str. FM013 n=1 Tax=Penicillium camemberti (strain FM 013) TaxID=1429867 RepID=A0A0G4PGC7_PENC3|nr:unnamed protein product [Penicillium camemberti]
MMNRRAQYTLAKAPNRTDLPYYDEIQTTPTGILICPPGWTNRPMGITKGS